MNQTLNLSIEPAVVEALTKKADQAGVSRSAFVETLVRVYGDQALTRLLRAAGKVD